MEDTKRAVLDLLRGAGVLEGVRDLLAQEASSIQKGVTADAGGVPEKLSPLEEKHLLDKLLRSFQRDSSWATKTWPDATAFDEVPPVYSELQSVHRPSSSNAAIRASSTFGPSSSTLQQDPASWYLHVKMLEGAAFLENLDMEEAEEDGGSSSTQDFLLLSMQYGDQGRCLSKPTACRVEPPFDDHFVFQIPAVPPSSSSAKRTTNLLTSERFLSEPRLLHMVVLRQRPSGRRAFVASATYDFRKAICGGTLLASVELGSSKGVLNMRLEMTPRPNANIVSGQTVAARIREDAEMNALVEEDLVEFSENWWREFRQIRPQNESRPVRFFTKNEEGVERPVCAFVQPLMADRVLSSPQEAARFVSLLPYERADMSTEMGRQETWHSLHTFVSRQRGGVESHAQLLCSLLLGFGLNAYMCLGTIDGNTHAWVMTIDTEGGVTLWESLTGVRYPLSEPAKRNARPHKFEHIFTVFNHREFYGNIQPDTHVSVTNWDFTNDRLWKGVEEQLLARLRPEAAVSLTRCVIDTAAEERHIEMELQKAIQEVRESEGLSSLWDDRLSYLLAPALVGYESELQLSSGTQSSISSSADFAEALKLYVPQHHSFKGYPTVSQHRNATRILQGMMRNSICADILSTVGDSVRFGLRCKVFPYAEDICAVWVMVAVRFQAPANSSTTTSTRPGPPV